MVDPSPRTTLTSAFRTQRFAPEAMTFVPGTDERLEFQGRFDTRNPSCVPFVWQASVVRTKWRGSRLGVRLTNVHGRSLFDLFVDGKPYFLPARENEDLDYLLEETFDDAWHEVRLYKRSEAFFGNATFEGFYFDRDELERPARLAYKFEFYGDSITAGACNLDAEVDQYDDLSTHDHSWAYPAIVCRELGAEETCIAVSGVGVCRTWNTVTMPQIFDRLYPDPESPRFDFLGRSSDVVVVNLGQNDHGYPYAFGQPFPLDYCDQYVRLVHKIRSHAPRAWIVCALGGMSAWKESKHLLEQFRQAVARLKADDPRVTSLVFRAYSELHPRVDVHRKLATELIDFLSREILDRL